MEESNHDPTPSPLIGFDLESLERYLPHTCDPPDNYVEPDPTPRAAY